MEAVIGSTLVSGAGEISVADALAEKDFVILYFSAHWCGPCRAFTPRLAEYYGTHADSKRFEVVFVSHDRSQAQFDEYFGSMPWKAIPFTSSALETAKNAIEYRGIPTVAILSKDGTVVNDNARGDIQGDPAATGFPYSVPTNLWEVLDDSVALTAGDGSAMTVAELKTKDYVALYFSAHWCGPCRAFLEPLTAWYTANKDAHNLEIVFVSSDRGESQYADYRASMPWAALPLGVKKDELSKLCSVEGIPTLTIFSKDGEVAVEGARAKVISKPDGFPWPPQPVEPLDDIVSSINDQALLILFTDGVEDVATVVTASEALHAAAKPIFEAAVASGSHPVRFAISTAADRQAGPVRGFLNIGGGLKAVIVNIPGGKKYVMEGDVTQDALDAFVAGFVGGAIEGVGIRE